MKRVIEQILGVQHNNDGISGAGLKSINDVFLKTRAIHRLNLKRRTLFRFVYIYFFYIQGVYKYCAFSDFFKSIPNSVFPRCQCVYTHQAGRKPALQQNWQSSEKLQHFKEKTQYLINTLYISVSTYHSLSSHLPPKSKSKLVF